MRPVSAAAGQVLHNIVPSATAELRPLERLAATNRLDLAIGLPLRNTTELGQLLRQLYDPASPNYHRYLTPAQFTDRFGPTANDYQAVIAFVQANGLRVTQRHPNRVVLDVSGAVPELERALHIKINVYQHPTEARTFYASDKEPTLDLAAPVLGISGLDNYAPSSPLFFRLPMNHAQITSPDLGSGPDGYYIGKDFRAAYVPDSVLTGSGQSVGLLEFDGYTTSDITYYESLAGLPSVPLTNVLLDGFSGHPTGDGGEVEVSLDIEMAISMAPGLSKVIVYEAGPNGSWHDMLNRMANDNLAKQLSCSWYIPGGGPDPVAEQIFQQMAAQGQSFFAASGDFDAYTGLIPFPSDTTNVTEVGGTTLSTSGPGGSWVGETVWNWGNGIGSGGGISTSYAIPSWQTNINMATNKGSTTMHNVPDVAFTADNVYVRADGENDGVGGTSCAAPLWAAFTALVNQQAVMTGHPTVGFINSALDAIASGPTYSQCFHDITTGNNTSSASPQKFYGVAGYDLCTGWGVPAGQSLINALANPDPLGIQPDTGFTAIGRSGGPFTIYSEGFVLTNGGTNSLTWSMVTTSLWLTVSPPGGTLPAGGTVSTPLVSLSSGASNLPIGNYTATVLFSNNTSGVAQNRQFGLQIVPPVPPTIQTPPTNQFAAVGTTKSFSVAVSGTPPLLYQWQFDGNNINGATNTSLTLTNISFSEAGTYSVSVTNTLGSNYAAALLTVGNAPSIVTQPQNQELVQGSNATFSVTAAGTAPLSYQWYFYGTVLAQATNSTFAVTNVQATNGGFYSVAVSSPFGSVLSSNAVLTVELFPIIVTQPQNQYGDIGSNVTFSVSATGNSSTLPPVSSGTLQLWLKADTGVTTNSAGLVSMWQDQSGNNNGAVQTTTALQPALAFPGGLGGKPVVRFDGIQNNVNGSYLFGSGTVDVPNAMTEFTVYDAFSATNNENVILDIGIPSQYGANRIAMITGGDLHFSFWASDFNAPFLIPTNTYRIRTDRLDTNLDTLNMFDATGVTETNFTLPVGSAVTPGPGYYIGGLNSSIEPTVGSSRNFDGDIAEIICYQGYLSEVDRLQVTSYLEQKYFLSGSPGGLSFQWQFNGTNIAGATNETLTLTNVQFANVGVYSVTVSNLVGVVTSSNAMLVVGYAPSITAQPQSQEVTQGTNVSLTVTAAGTAPLNYQWYLDGAALAQDTNSSLTLTNVQSANSGSYSVAVSSLFGSILSSNAVLTVELFPIIITQPQNLYGDVGSNVTFSVIATGSSSALPSVASGTLQLWLKADTGVTTNSAGLVNLWQDLSGNSNNAAQATASLQPTLAFAAGLGGKPVVRFNGIQNNINGSYLFGSGTVDVSNAMTEFAVYNAFSATNDENVILDIGIPGQYGANRIAMITGGDLHFSFWSYDFSAPFVVPTNTYRIRTDRLDTNLDTLNMFDATTTSGTNFTLSVNGALTPGAGYYLGGLNSSAGPNVGSSRNFDGDIAEIICYQGYLSEADRLAVTSYLEQKYFQNTTSNGVSFQWQFDGTNIAGATNTFLTLTNLQITNDGTYTVLVSNLVGVTTSSNAVLAVGNAPSITSEPQGQVVKQGTNVSFAVTATGTAPLNYQWYLNGAPLALDTNSTLTLSNVQSDNSGSYTVAVTSPFGSILSSNAVLAVELFPVIVTQPQSQNILVGTNVTFSVLVGGSGGGAPTLPTVTSGTLQLWLKADTGLVTNSAGLVSQWQDQSGNSNHAAQASANLQPTLAFPAGLNGKPVVRFNGVQNNVNGSYLFGSRTVNASGAMTAFTVYDAFSTSNDENVILDIGIPGQYGANRIVMITGGDLHFSLWSYDFNAPFVIPTNTYRIRTDQLATNLASLNMFDASPLTSTNFTLSVNNAVTPGAGYYLGGLNSSLSGVGSSRNFDGDMAEVICYSGYLSQADRMAVTNYLAQKYYQNTSAGNVSYQWQFDGANIAGATNASLTLTNAQITNDGTYTVTISNVIGVTTSSNALLAVGNAPAITAQPQGQEVVQGSNVIFSVTVTGTSPLNYQWYFNGAALAQDTNSTLDLTNVQSANSGSYSVVISSLFGTVFSSNAVLTVDLFPIIQTQPQSQLAFIGTNVTFSVKATGSSPTLPVVSSGTLQLWLEADTGLVTSSAGLVSQWLDQSGNGNHAAQAATNLQPALAYAAGLNGKPVVRFNGIQNNINGSYLFGSGTVNVPNAMTSFTLYDAFSATNFENVLCDIGIPGQYGANRIVMITGGDLHFSFWTYDYSAPFIVPTNTYRFRIDQLDTNLDSLNMFDATAGSETNFTLSVDGAVTPGAGYYLGGLNSSLSGVGLSRNFDGDIAEVICYSGALSQSDLMAVTNYLAQKYFQGGASGNLAYQWQFNGTNIAGATNAALTLTNVGLTNAGDYTVILSNKAGSVTSSNAVLTIISPPAISVQPQSQSGGLDTSVTFNVVASGSGLLGYQWQFDGSNITHATSSSLTISSIQSSNAGTYAVVVTDPYGSITSSNAVLTVLTSAVEIVSASANGSTTALVPVQLVSAGNENSLYFSLNYNSSVLTYTGVTAGSNATGAFLIANTSQTGSGSLGLELLLPGSAVFSAGTQQLAVVSFAVAQLSNAVVTPITFGSQPTAEDIFNPQSVSLPGTYSNGLVTIAATRVEGDVSPRPNGDGVVLLNDWLQEGRFVAGLDTVSSTNEFERADCAPRGTSGDGLITVADWVQVGRYAGGFDPPTYGSNRTATGTISNTASATRILELASVVQGQLINTVNLQLTAQGNENALSCSLTFDPMALSFLGATLGSGAPDAILEVNTNQVYAGNLGLALALLPGTAISPGTQPVVQLSFLSISYGSNTLNLTLGDVPVPRQIADTNAAILPVSFENASLAVAGTSNALLWVSRNATNVFLTWSAAATGFTLQSASSLGQNWTSVPGTPVTNGNYLTLPVVISTNNEFFRLMR